MIENTKEWIDLILPNLLNNNLFSLESINCDRCHGHQSIIYKFRYWNSFVVRCVNFVKHKCVSFSLNDKMSTSFCLIPIRHIDMGGLSKILNISGARGFVTFIGVCTLVIWVYLLKQKSKAISIFLQFF